MPNLRRTMAAGLALCAMSAILLTAHFPAVSAKTGAKAIAAKTDKQIKEQAVYEIQPIQWTQLAIRTSCGQACRRGKILRAVVRKADHALASSGYLSSPLRRQLVGIVKAARAAGISPFFLLAIAGTESGFGVQACGGNAWGWASCQVTFNNFTQGASAVAKALRANYLDHHLNTVDTVSRVYCPPTASSWAGKVRFFMTRVFGVEEGLRWSDAVHAVKT